MPGSIVELGNNKYKLIVSCGYKNGPQVRRCKTVEARTKAAVNKKLAVFYAQVQAEMQKKQRQNVRPAVRTKMTVTDLIDVWTEKYGSTLSPTTAQSDKINIKNNILPYIGKRQADAIKADDVLWLIAELRNRPKMRDPTKKLSETIPYINCCAQFITAVLNGGWLIRIHVKKYRFISVPSQLRVRLRFISMMNLNALCRLCGN